MPTMEEAFRGMDLDQIIDRFAQAMGQQASESKIEGGAAGAGPANRGWADPDRRRRENIGGPADPTKSMFGNLFADMAKQWEKVRKGMDDAARSTREYYSAQKGIAVSLRQMGPAMRAASYGFDKLAKGAAQVAGVNQANLQSNPDQIYAQRLRDMAKQTMDSIGKLPFGIGIPIQIGLQSYIMAETMKAESMRARMKTAGFTDFASTQVVGDLAQAKDLRVAGFEPEDIGAAASGFRNRLPTLGDSAAQRRRIRGSMRLDIATGKGIGSTSAMVADIADETGQALGRLQSQLMRVDNAMIRSGGHFGQFEQVLRQFTSQARLSSASVGELYGGFAELRDMYIAQGYDRATANAMASKNAANVLGGPRGPGSEFLYGKNLLTRGAERGALRVNRQNAQTIGLTEQELRTLNEGTPEQRERILRGVDPASAALLYKSGRMLRGGASGVMDARIDAFRDMVLQQAQVKNLNTADPEQVKHLTRVIQYLRGGSEEEAMDMVSMLQLRDARELDFNSLPRTARDFAKNAFGYKEASQDPMLTVMKRIQQELRVGMKAVDGLRETVLDIYKEITSWGWGRSAKEQEATDTYVAAQRAAVDKQTEGKGFFGRLGVSYAMASAVERMRLAMVYAADGIDEEEYETLKSRNVPARYISAATAYARGNIEVPVLRMGEGGQIEVHVVQKTGSKSDARNSHASSPAALSGSEPKSGDDS